MSLVPNGCVVAPVNFSPESFDAVATALTLVDRPEDVRVVHVLPPGEADEFDSVWTPTDPDVRKDDARRALATQLAKQFPRGVEPHVLMGEPAAEIAEFAESHGAKLVVVPHPRKSIWARLFNSSFAEQLVRLCRCPVLVLNK